MGSIADSSAATSPNVWPQHQAAITLLGLQLAEPGASHVTWLDLACGRGQILNQLEKNISDEKLRAKISYAGYDIENESRRVTEKIAESLKLGKVDVKTGEMEQFTNVFPPERKFTFVSFTNTVHELRPHVIAGLLLDLILRLAPRGVLYIYDMEALPVPELGAVPWAGSDVKRVLDGMFDDLGCAKPGLMVQGWQHNSCTGWSLALHREHLGVTDDVITARAGVVIDKAGRVIGDVLAEKLKTVTSALDSLTRFGSETEEEDKQKHKLLFDYWSLQRAIAAQK
jgi:SAM-dependent methyltransferase